MLVSLGATEGDTGAEKVTVCAGVGVPEGVVVTVCVGDSAGVCV